MLGSLVLLLAVAHLVTGVQFETLTTVNAIVEPYSSVKGAITYSKTTAPVIVKSQTVSGAPFIYLPSTTKPSGIQAFANQTITITYTALPQVTYLYCIGWPVGTYVFSAGVQLRSHTGTWTLTGTSLKITVTGSGIIQFPTTAKILKWTGTLTTAAATAKLIFTLGVPDIVCTAPTVDSSLTKGACTGVQGTTCTFTCGAGFKAATYVSTACTKNGTYAFTGANTPTKCTPITCTAPTGVSTSLKKGTCTGAFNTVCTYNCDTASGYVAQTYTSKPCTVSGAYTFAPVLPTVCAASPCASQPSSTIGLSATCTQTVSGAKCNRTCDSGYTGSVSFTCTRGSWGAATGVCAANPCNSEPTLVTGITTTSCSGKASGSTCSVTCDSGYTGSVSYLCATGSWGTATGTCSANPCNSEPTLVTGITTTTCSGKASGSTCDVTCDSGYTGSVSYLCTTGSWGTATGSCSANPCTTQPTAVTGLTTTCSTTTSGNACTRTCDSGYTGTVSYTCTAASWGSASGTCSANPCTTQPTAITGLTTPCTTTASGLDCTRTCDSGYTGSVSYTCLRGNWGSASGTCTESPCTTQPPATFGLAATTCSQTASNSACTRTCDSGYTGTVSYSCSKGSWGTATGSCLANCQSAPSFSRYTVSGCPGGVPDGRVCTVTCASGYTTTSTGSLTTTCSNGTWSQPTGNLCFASCTTNPGPYAALVGPHGSCVSGTVHGAICYTYCNPTDLIGGSFYFQCIDGAWSNYGSASSNCDFTARYALGATCNSNPTTQMWSTKCTVLGETASIGSITCASQYSLYSDSVCGNKVAYGTASIIGQTSQTCTTAAGNQVAVGCTPYNQVYVGFGAATCNQNAYHTLIYAGTCMTVGTGSIRCGGYGSSTYDYFHDRFCGNYAGTINNNFCTQTGTIDSTSFEAAWATVYC